MDIKSYADAVRQVLPGTFVPDVTPGGGTPSATPEVAPVAGGSFKDAVKSFLGGVNEKMATSDKLTTELAAGQTHNSEKVITSVEEANLAFQFTLAVRNKLLTAYQEIQQMQV